VRLAAIHGAVVQRPAFPVEPEGRLPLRRVGLIARSSHLDRTMRGRYLASSGALTVTAVTAVLVILDLTVGTVHRFWSRHSFTSSVVAGLLVLLLTVLIVDRVVRIRQLRNQSRAIAIQAAIIVAQAQRTANAIVDTAPSAEDQAAALD
jgi:hypothetical protein